VLRQIAGYAAIAGAVILIGLTASTLFRAQRPPPPLVGVLVLTGFVQIAIGIGLLRGQRVAWAFALALYIVGSLVALLGLPAMIRGGMAPVLAVTVLFYAVGMIVIVGLTDPGKG
jgi:hypothetical protein